MRYAVGDTVVHWTYGLGKVIAIDEMDLAGATQPYYVVEVERLKLWIPLEEAHDGSIRPPLESSQFETLFAILKTRGQPLPDHFDQRKNGLRARMQKRTLADVCHVIRDLSDRSRHYNLNDNDAAVLFRAQEHLLDEWVISLGIDRSQALETLEVLIRENQPEAKHRKGAIFRGGGVQQI